MTVKSIWTSRDVEILAKHAITIVSDLKERLQRKRVILNAADGSLLSLGRILHQGQETLLPVNHHMKESSIKQALSAGNMKQRLLAALIELEKEPRPALAPAVKQIVKPEATVLPVVVSQQMPEQLSTGTLIDMLLGRFKAELLSEIDQRLSAVSTLLKQQSEESHTGILQAVKAEVESLQEYITRPVSEVEVVTPNRPSTTVVAVKTKKHRIDVVGLLPSQTTIVSANSIANKFNIRFLTTDEGKKANRYAHHVVLCTKFINHSIQERVKNAQSIIHYANGGPESVVKELYELSKQPALFL